jgi:homoserine kinase type II
MAVYTHVSEREMRELGDRYRLGALVGFAGVEQGVENTNYILTTEKGRFVLTLFERRVEPGDLPFFMAAMAHMTDRGVPAPTPLADRSGKVIASVAGRPAAITSFLAGAQRMAPSAADARAMGAMTARLHHASAGFGLFRANALGPKDWRRIATAIGADADRCSAGFADFIAAEIAFIQQGWPSALPRGLVHADLFPDNVFFIADNVSGVIDFYFSCTDYFAYDLAIALNAWCWREGEWLDANARSFLAGYNAVRRLSAEECAALPTLMRGAALRILLTRLFDFLNQVKGAVVKVKDPLEYRALLEYLRANSGSIPGCDS